MHIIFSGLSRISDVLQDIRGLRKILAVIFRVILMVLADEVLGGL